MPRKGGKGVRGEFGGVVIPEFGEHADGKFHWGARAGRGTGTARGNRRENPPPFPNVLLAPMAGDRRERCTALAVRLSGCVARSQGLRLLGKAYHAARDGRFDGVADCVQKDYDLCDVSTQRKARSEP